MPIEIDIYRSAKLLIDQHGKDAPIFAAMQADACLEKGDLDGKAVCMRVIRGNRRVSEHGHARERTVSALTPDGLEQSGFASRCKRSRTSSGG